MVIAWDWDDADETAAARAFTGTGLKILAEIAMSDTAPAEDRAHAKQKLGEWLSQLKARWDDPITPPDERELIAAALQNFLD